jgi:hypothetical protein
MFAAGVSTVWNYSMDSMRAIHESKNIKKHLQDPDSLYIYSISTAVLKEGFHFTEYGEDTEDSDVINKILEDKPLITYVMYFARAADGYLGHETFILIDGEPFASVTDSEGNPSVVSPEFGKESLFAVGTLFDIAMNPETYGASVNELDREDIQDFLFLPTYVELTFFVFSMVLAINVAYSMFRRRRTGISKPIMQEIIDSLVDFAYPDSALPQSYKTVSVNRKKCHVWVGYDTLCVMQTKASLKKQATKNMEMYDTEEKVKQKIFRRNIGASSIANVELVEGKGYLLKYRELDSLKTLVIDESAQDFVESMQRQLQLQTNA